MQMTANKRKNINVLSRTGKQYKKYAHLCFVFLFAFLLLQKATVFLSLKNSVQADAV